MSAYSVIALSERLAAFAVIVASAELLVAHSQLGRCGFLNVEIISLRFSWTTYSLIAQAINWLFRYPRIKFVVGLRLALAVFVVVSPESTPIRGLATALLVATAIALHMALPLGHDGADQMVTVVLASCAISRLLSTDTGKGLCLGFIAAQVCLAYVASGVAKLTSAQWRSGECLPHLLSTRQYGAVWAGRFLKLHFKLCRVVAV